MKSDKEIWNEKFKNGDTIKDFTTKPGPPLKKDKKILEKSKFWAKPKKLGKTLEQRVEELEKDIKQLKKYLNQISRQRRNNYQEPPQQPNRTTNETETE